MIELFFLLLAVLCSGCINIGKYSQYAIITFMESDKVCLHNEVYDVSDKNKSYEMRCKIKEVRELIFEHIGEASARALWNIIDPVSSVSDQYSLTPIVCSIRLESGYVMPVFFGPRCSYFVVDEKDVDVGISADANLPLSEIDFSAIDLSKGGNVYLELKCDLNMQQCDNLERILLEFAKHGTGEHQVFLLFY